MNEKEKQEHVRAIRKLVVIVMVLVVGLALVSAGASLMNQPNDVMVFIGLLMIVVAFSVFARTVWVFAIKTPQAIRDEVAAAEERRREEAREARRRQADSESKDRAERWAEQTIRDEAEEQTLRSELERLQMEEMTRRGE